MHILPLRVLCLCANSLSEHVTMITAATCKAICMQEGPVVGWGFPGFSLPHKLWGIDGALRPLPASPPHSPASAGPKIPVGADHSARWSGYIGGDAAGFCLLLLFGFFVQRYRQFCQQWKDLHNLASVMSFTGTLDHLVWFTLILIFT
jgi:hypothetical protein